MTSDDGDDPQDWRYARYHSLRGALQRGRGLAVAQLRYQPEHADLVYECTSRDTRWDWQVDARCTYLARLLRNTRLDPAPPGALHSPTMRAAGWPSYATTRLKMTKSAGSRPNASTRADRYRRG